MGVAFLNKCGHDITSTLIIALLMSKFRIFATVAMDQQALHESIKQVSTRITEEDISLLVSCAVPRELKKGDTILKEGEVCRSFYLVEKGYLRTFCNNKDGATINLNFTFEGQKQEWQFYLPDPEHVQQLGALFKDFYAKRIPFVERSATSSRTYLFAPVSKEKWEDLMIENGYL